MLMMHSTKQRLLNAGMAMLLEHGYNDLGIQALLAATGLSLIHISEPTRPY